MVSRGRRLWLCAVVAGVMTLGFSPLAQAATPGWDWLHRLGNAWTRLSPVQPAPYKTCEGGVATDPNGCPKKPASRPPVKPPTGSRREV